MCRRGPGGEDQDRSGEEESCRARHPGQPLARVGAAGDGEEPSDAESVEAAGSQDLGGDLVQAGKRQGHPEDQGEERAPDADLQQGVARGDPHDDWPEQVEVLFHGQRPEMADVGERPRAPLRDEQVDAIRPDPRLVARRLLERRRIQRTGQRQYEEEDEEDGVVERKDPEDPAHVEVAKVMARASRIVEDPRDQVTGEDEEEVHAVDAVVAGLHEQPLEGVVRLGIADEVHEQHQDDGEPADPVQDGNVRIGAAPSGAPSRPCGRTLTHHCRPGSRRVG